jgi:hypothetical protein
MKKYLIAFLLLLVIIFSAWVYWKYYFTYSEGNRSGLLQKFSYKGNIFKTYEGELILNSLVINGIAPVSSEKFYFSVESKTLGERMKNYEGKRVVLQYKEKKGVLFWRGDSNYIVDSVRLVEP